MLSARNIERAETDLLDRTADPSSGSDPAGQAEASGIATARQG
jgi:hypothetical protein